MFCFEIPSSRRFRDEIMYIYVSYNVYYVSMKTRILVFGIPPCVTKPKKKILPGTMEKRKTKDEKNSLSLSLSVDDDDDGGGFRSTAVFFFSQIFPPDDCEGCETGVFAGELYFYLNDKGKNGSTIVFHYNNYYCYTIIMWSSNLGSSPSRLVVVYFKKERLCKFSSCPQTHKHTPTPQARHI